MHLNIHKYFIELQYHCTHNSFKYLSVDINYTVNATKSKQIRNSERGSRQPEDF